MLQEHNEHHQQYIEAGKDTNAIVEYCDYAPSQF